MTKRLLLTTAIGLALGTAAFAQTAADPSKTDTNQPAAAQAETIQTEKTRPQANTAPASITLSAGVSVTDPERTRIIESIARMNVKPLTGVDFSVSVGSSVPRELRVYPLPAEVVDIVPPYRDHRFLVVDNKIAVIEPSTRKIVTVLPRDGAATATATPSTPIPSSQPAAKTRQSSTEPDRAPAKKHASTRSQRKMSSRAGRDDARWARGEIRVGQRVPDHVVLYELPPSLYSELPARREYRYTQRGARSYVAGPRSRTYYEEID